MLSEGKCRQGSSVTGEISQVAHGRKDSIPIVTLEEIEDGWFFKNDVYLLDRFNQPSEHNLSGDHNLLSGSNDPQRRR